MRFRRFALLSFALLVLGVAPALRVRAEEAPSEEAPPEEGLSDAEVRQLTKELKVRAKNWWNHRRRMAIDCPECKGTGKVRWGGSRSGPLVACAECNATKIFVDEKEFLACEHEMRTPTFRLQEDVLGILAEELVLARKGRPSPDVVKRYAIKEIELVDDVHAIVHVKKDRDSVARPQRWVRAREAGEDPDWYLYDPVDGPWPGEEKPAAGTPEKPTPPQPSEEPERRPRPVPRSQPPPARREPTRGPQDRDEIEASKQLVEKWGEDRNDMTARVIRIELGLAKVEGNEDTVAQARVFLGEIKAWMEEVKPVYERAKKEVEEEGLGVLLADRLKVNTKHFKAFRRLELTEKMLIVLVPDLRDG